MGAHNIPECRAFAEYLAHAARYAQSLGLPADRAVRAAGSLACEVPPLRRQAAITAVLDVWAAPEVAP